MIQDPSTSPERRYNLRDEKMTIDRVDDTTFHVTLSLKSSDHKVSGSGKDLDKLIEDLRLELDDALEWDDAVSDNSI